jgi:hypothetical protein
MEDMTMSDTPTAEKNKPPVAEARSLDGKIRIPIWENEGQYGPRYSSTVNRRYKDKDGKWQDSGIFFEDDMAELALTVTDARAKIKALKEADAQARREEREAETTAA